MQTSIDYPLLSMLKKHSDVFCPVMTRVHPMTPEEHLEMCLETLEFFGVTFDGVIQYDIEAGLTQEEQLVRHLQRLSDNDVCWHIDHSKAPQYIKGKSI
jgi:hypothetical protein